MADGDATGLLVTATQPVTATLRSQADGDLSHAVADPVVDGAATVLLPEAAAPAKTLVLAGAVKAGSVEVVARSSDGRELSTDTVDLAPDRGASLKLPDATALLTVTPRRSTVAGAVLVAGQGAAVVPLTVPALNGLVPAVAPGLP